MLRIDTTACLVIDVQGKLAQVMNERELLFDNLQRLIKGLVTLGVPILWAEQIPEKMGQTIAEVRALLEPQIPIRKSSFSCWGEPAFRTALEALNRKQLVVAGIEAHVCVYQTCQDLCPAGYEVQVVTDAVSSRAKANKDMALAKLSRMGVEWTSVEMALFELMQTADHPAFRDLLRIVR